MSSVQCKNCLCFDCTKKGRCSPCPYCKNSAECVMDCNRYDPKTNDADLTK